MNSSPCCSIRIGTLHKTEPEESEQEILEQWPAIPDEVNARNVREEKLLNLFPEGANRL